VEAKGWLTGKTDRRNRGKGENRFGEGKSPKKRGGGDNGNFEAVGKGRMKKKRVGVVFRKKAQIPGAVGVGKKVKKKKTLKKTGESMYLEGDHLIGFLGKANGSTCIGMSGGVEKQGRNRDLGK